MSTPEIASLIPRLLRLQAAADIVWRALGHRGELAALECKAARSELATTGVLVAAATVALLLAGFALTLLVAAIFWDTPHRVTAICGLAGGEIVVGLVAGAWARRRWRSWEPLTNTRRQLQQDAECVREILRKTPA